MRPAPRRMSDLAALADLKVASTGILRFYDPVKGFGYVAIDKGPDAYVPKDVAETCGIDISKFVEGASFRGTVTMVGTKGRVQSIAEIGAPKSGLTARPGARTEKATAKLVKFDAALGVGIFRAVGREERIMVDAATFEREGVEVNINYDYDVVFEKHGDISKVLSMSGPDLSVKRYASTQCVYDQYDPDRILLMAGMTHDETIVPETSISPIPDTMEPWTSGGFGFGLRFR